MIKKSFWSGIEPGVDTYSFFRGTFDLEAPAEVEFRVVGSSWYQGWLNGQPLLEGPLRFALERPEYQSHKIYLKAGRHLLAFHAHHIGVETRILKVTPPFIWCEACVDEQLLEIAWRCIDPASQASGTRRINPQLGWMECRDTRKEPQGWELPGFDDSAWGAPVFGVSPLPESVRADMAPTETVCHQLEPVAEGPLATTFGYPSDEPAFVFYSRDRVCQELPPRGTWQRYDLGRVRLGRPSFALDLPAGAVVEIAMSEVLTEGQVSPYINLSAGTSCNLDRYIARGGPQTFCPLTPKGGRFVEIHILHSAGRPKFIREAFLERGYHAASGAEFRCGDPVLERIWSVGIETYRACAEDALIDNPTRERGQWVGDVASVGMEIASVAFHDLRLCKRALVQSALCPREDGLVAGMSPGGCAYLPTYAFQWVVAVENYFRHTGDRELLEELWDYALRNLEAIHAFWRPDGLHHVAGWNFIDWGYKPEDGPVDTACNLHYLWALRSMIRWAETLGRDASVFMSREQELTPILETLLQKKCEAGSWNALGYHVAALSMRLGLIDDEPAGLDYLQSHLLSCFPNDKTAPRNDDPMGFNARLITPYFAHYVMPLFIERGRMDFVLDQYRTCWGWMLEDDRTTWVEVFDTRWSHCHQWSGCPTWQMSRYLLGLHPRLDMGPGTFDFRLEPGSLKRASGRIPHPSGGWIDVAWERTDAGIILSIQTEEPVCLNMGNGEIRQISRKSSCELTLMMYGDGN